MRGASAIWSILAAGVMWHWCRDSRDGRDVAGTRCAVSRTAPQPLSKVEEMFVPRHRGMHGKQPLVCTFAGQRTVIEETQSCDNCFKMMTLFLQKKMLREKKGVEGCCTCLWVLFGILLNAVGDHHVL
jgi:hypothetical protein